MRKTFKIIFTIALGVMISQCGDAKKAAIPVSDGTNNTNTSFGTSSDSSMFSNSNVTGEVTTNFGDTTTQSAIPTITAQGPYAVPDYATTNTNSSFDTNQSASNPLGDLLQNFGNNNGSSGGGVIDGFKNANTVPGQPLRNVFRRIFGGFSGALGG